MKNKPTNVIDMMNDTRVSIQIYDNDEQNEKKEFNMSPRKPTHAGLSKRDAKDKAEWCSWKIKSDKRS